MLYAVLLFALVFDCRYVLAAVYPVDDTGGVGRTFDGIGGLSGGGATSKLLVNYPQPQRDEILDYLFKPNFGASLHLLKVEIGGDAQSTDGTEASHMHYPWDENYQRGYEWWLMKEAKKRNPKILLYCLPWAFPAWVGAGTRSPYHAPNVTAGYVMKFIQGAKAYHNLTMDFVGVWNERPYNSDYIIELRKQLDSAGLQHTRIVAADGNWEPISTDVTKSPELSKAVDIIGVHYPGTNGSDKAMKTGKQLWSSEDYSTVNDNVGAGCWARILNQNYVNGYMTSTISWNLIASYYEALPYARCALMTADSPWSGFYRVDATIWMSAHTSQFTKPGWTYYKHDAGVTHLKSGGSMVSLICPMKKDLTIVIETMSHDHSLCIRPHLPAYKVSPQNVTIQLKGTFAKLFKVNIWYSKLGFNGDTSILMKSLGSMPVVNGKLTLSVGVDEVYTITTLEWGTKGVYPDPPAVTPFPLPYMDDFESYQEFNEPYNLSPQTGTYEVITTKLPHENVIRQMVIDTPCNWCDDKSNGSLAVIGNYSWSDIYVEVQTFVGTVNATEGVFVAARVDKGGCESFGAQGIFFFIFPAKGKFGVFGDLARTQKLREDKASVSPNQFYTMALLVKDGYAAGSLNGAQLFNISTPKKPQHGFVGLGTANYGLADFDDFKITSSADGEMRMKQKLKYSESGYGGKQEYIGDLDNDMNLVLEEDKIEQTETEFIEINNAEDDILYFKSLKTFQRKYKYT